MTAAGVQNIDSASYVPAPRPSSTSDARGASAAVKQPTDPQSAATSGETSDFHSELAMQSDNQETDPAGKPVSGKTGGGKSGKKRDALADDPNPSAVTPVQVAEAQKQILPLMLMLPQTNEPVKPDEQGQTSESQDPTRQSALDAYPSVEPSPDSSKGHVVPLAPPLAPPQDIPVPQVPGSPEQATKTSKAGLNLSEFSPEPVAAAVQETVDSAPSSPSALAFAARFAAASQETVEPVAANPSPSLAVSGSEPATQIPVRYAATAQIIQSAAGGPAQDGPKKDPGNSDERFARPDARNDIVLPRFEAASEPIPSSASAAAQRAAPMTRPESIIEPPAAAPTSSHDIRVRVPDNNGGSMQVRFVESGGEVRVSVRTADEALAQNLRTHLNDLTQRLSDGGTPAEIWKPASSATSAQNDPQQQGQPDGRGSGGQGSGSQSGQQDRQQKRPAWLEEMEASLHGEQN